MRLSYEKGDLITALRDMHGDIVTRKQVLAFTTASDIECPHWLFNNKAYRAGRGSYDLSKVITSTTTPTVVEQATV